MMFIPKLGLFTFPLAQRFVFSVLYSVSVQVEKILHSEIGASAEMLWSNKMSLLVRRNFWVLL